ncbi:unnamed protein product [Schistosoma turkestanicum]|nr:unnamed protein product [Schistosoma turkestanicum]
MFQFRRENIPYSSMAPTKCLLHILYFLTAIFSYFLAPRDIFPYEKFKHKYGVPRNKAVFQAGLREIEENPDVLLYKKDPEAEKFLAQFYSFKRGCEDTSHNSTAASSTVEIQSQKRSKSTSAELEHGRSAKRLHTEPQRNSCSVNNHHPRSAQKNKRSSLVKCVKKSPTTTNNLVKSSNQSMDVTVESDDSVPVEEDSRRVSALRLRIRKQSTVSMSRDSVSPSSPSTTGSTATLEAHHVGFEQSHVSSNDPLKIIIRQNTSMSPIVSIEEKLKPRPIVSVTPTRSTASGNSMNQPDTTTHRTRSTAVVTPLLRNVLPELSDDDSSDSVTSTNDANLKTNNIDNKLGEKTTGSNQDSERNTYRTDSIRLRRRPAKQGRYSTEFIMFTNVKSSRKRSPSISPKLSSRNWEKSPMELTSKSVDVRTSSVVSSNSTVIVSPSTAATFNNQDVKDKEQQLKDLDTEERLLLIDRSIKSSLIQGHEDIATCVDRLELLDKMTISLPIMARCWTVVETIRKCRRYKRSLEVKIAAQKVFNKFLQLYATADKNELDLAHAELIKHQQRHMKKHLPCFNKGDSLEETVSMSGNSIPPYMGPKSMADLFQLTIRSTKSDIPDVKKTCDEKAKRTSETLQSPSSIDATPNVSKSLERFDQSTVNTDKATTATIKLNTTDCESQSYSSHHSPLKGGFQIDVSVQDIPLPEETPTQFISPKETVINSTDIMTTCKDIDEMPPEDEDIEEEFELLDVYEEPEEPTDTYLIQQSDCKFPIVQSSSEQSNFIQNKSISLSTTPEQAGFTVTPMSDISCSSSATYMGTYHPHLLITNNTLYPYPVFPNVPIQNPYRNHGHSLTNYSSPSQSNRQNVDATPPQSSSRAYIPHSLHPSEDPPPPYRPYIPTRCTIEQTQELKTSPDSSIKLPKESSHSGRITNNGGGGIQELASTTKQSNVHSDRRKVRDIASNNSISRETRTPPHRGRSPHALPHPLEHYQRYLKSALSAEDESSKNDTSRQLTDNSLQSHEILPNDQLSPNNSKMADEMKSHISPIDDDDHHTHHEIPFVSPSAEDLDTRIARLYDLAMRKNSMTTSTSSSSSAVDTCSNETTQLQKSTTTNPIVSPPPPPPPLPTSQRILFTHRPIHSNAPNSLTPLSSSSSSSSLQQQQQPHQQQELPLLLSHKNNNANNRNFENNTTHTAEPINRNNQISSSSLNEPNQCVVLLSRGSHPPSSDNIAMMNSYISSEISYKASEQQTSRNPSVTNRAVKFPSTSSDVVHHATNSYPRQPFNNNNHHHPHGARHYPTNPRHTTTTPPTTHPHIQRSNSNRAKLDSHDPLLSSRRRSDRDDDRDIYSMLGV